jgi:alpha-glucosidase (family GH31 glycosyl hydrolase)
LGLLAAVAGLSHAATLDSSFREGNTIFLRLSDGGAQIEWVSDSSFRFSRSWDRNFVRAPAINPQLVALEVSETAESLKITTQYLVLTLARRGVLTHVAEFGGAVIMEDATEPERHDGAITWERIAPQRARFFGLGPRDDAAVELRGSRLTALKPFLISSTGYGELHVAPGDYTFDIARAKSDRYRIQAHRAAKIDYYFFFGPAPKQVLEQLLRLDGPVAPLGPDKFGVLRPSDLPPTAVALGGSSVAGTIHSLINASLSGTILPAVSLDEAPESMRKRVIQLGSVSPLVTGSHPEWMQGTMRADLTTYLATYLEEARERGLPMIRPLPLQFSKDPEAAKINDEFMLGDELLVAPVHDSRATRTVYLPMGIWTRLSDNQEYPGRRTIKVEAGPDELPLFSRNGAILPLGSNPMKLHYFPRLGGEFFLLESDLGEYSQVHAGPAGDFMRLEIESKKEREYEWIVHHTERPRRVTAGEAVYTRAETIDRLRASTWFYDARKKNLHVRALGPIGADVVINVSF